MNATFKKAGVQVWFDTGRYRQPPKHKGYLCQASDDKHTRFVEIFQDKEVWFIRSAAIQHNDGSCVEDVPYPRTRTGFTLEEAKALAARFCETGSFSEGDNQ